MVQDSHCNSGTTVEFNKVGRTKIEHFSQERNEEMLSYF